MLYLYNEYFSFFSKLKRFLGKPSRGPEAVFESLTAGLTEIGQEYKINHPFNLVMETVCVLSGVNVLKDAIQHKQNGKIKTLIAGPNIVVHPNEANGILKSSAIDKIVVPSLWVKDFYSSIAPEITEKIFVWPAGVSDFGLAQESKNIDILYKSGDFNLVEEAYKISKEQGFSPSIIFYGKFDRKNYTDILKDTKLLVYISESESQGLALFEAWMANVPTLVWDRGYMQYENYKWTGNTSAPYLTKETGMLFKNLEDLKVKFKFMIENYSQFNPREYSLKNYTNKICAQKFIGILFN